LKKIEDILMMDEIRSLCQQALTDSEKCSIAMEQIYRQGFTDTPQLHEIEKQYVQRVFEIRRVQKQMYCDYIENPDAWRKEMLPEEPENQQVFSAGIVLCAQGKGIAGLHKRSPQFLFNTTPFPSLLQ